MRMNIFFKTPLHCINMGIIEPLKYIAFKMLILIKFFLVNSHLVTKNKTSGNQE